MQSKLLINILASLALIGLTVFVTVKLTVLDEQVVTTEKNEEVEGIAVENLKLSQEVELLENNLIALKEKKAFLQGGISENEKSSSELGEIILLLGEKRRSLVLEIKMLQNKKLSLDIEVSDLLEKSDNVNELLSNKDTKKNEENKNINELSLRLITIQEENEDLKKQITDIKSHFDTKLTDARKATLVLSSELKKIENRALDQKGTLKGEIKELSNQIQVLVAENKSERNLALSEKEQLIKQFKSEKNVLQIKKKTQDEIEKLKNLKSNFEKLNGLRVIFSGNMIYDEASSQIVFQAENSIGIPIFQDDFTGSIAGKCGLPIDKEIENRCSATIIAEFVVEKSGLFLRGKEIVEIVRK